MKKNFSSLENKKLKDLKTIQGGLHAGGGSSVRKADSNAGGELDSDYYTDATAGVWKWDHRLYVGELVSEGPA